MPLRTDSAAQSSIDEEIARHEKIIISLKTRRNALAAICQLPHDVISYLLLEIKQLGGREEWMWLKIQGVSRFWRDAAMKTPKLWSNISISEPAGCVSLAEVMLERTSSHPLYVTLSPPHKEPPHLQSHLDAPFWTVTERVLSQVGRMAALTFKDRSSESSSLRRTLQTIAVGSEASQLRVLNIDGNWRVNPQAIPLLFDVSMPSLQTLRLSGVRCLRNFPALPNLQELFLSQCLVSLEDTPVEEIVAVLLHVLKSTPKLNSLDLNALPTPLPSNPSSAKHTFSTVTLSLLESIHISWCHSSYELLLGHLDLPVVTHADLDLSHYEGDPPASLAHLCHFISRNPSFTDPAVPIHISMEFPRNLKVTSPDKPAFLLFINVPKPTQTSWQDYIRLFTLHAPATTYFSLTAEWQYTLSVGEVIRLYHQLEVLSFKFSSREWLLRDALKSLLKPSGDAMPPCPCLETIEFRVHLEDDAIPVLESVLQERVQFGVPIKRIRVFRDTKVRWWEDSMFNFKDLIEVIER